MKLSAARETHIKHWKAWFVHLNVPLFGVRIFITPTAAWTLDTIPMQLSSVIKQVPFRSVIVLVPAYGHRSSHLLNIVHL